MEPVWNVPNPVTVQVGSPQTFDIASWVSAPYPLILALAGALPAGFAFVAPSTLSWDGTGTAGDYQVDGLFSAEPDLDKIVATLTSKDVMIRDLQQDVIDMAAAREAEQAQDDQAKAKISAAQEAMNAALEQAKALL